MQRTVLLPNVAKYKLAFFIEDLPPPPISLLALMLVLLMFKNFYPLQNTDYTCNYFIFLYQQCDLSQNPASLGFSVSNKKLSRFIANDFHICTELCYLQTLLPNYPDINR